MRITDLQKSLLSISSPERARKSEYFFKTGPGQYGEGDVFIGVSVPDQRKIAKQFNDLPLTELDRLIRSPEHEFRLTALFILVDQFKKARKDEISRKKIVDFYLDHLSFVNNWDLVDSSAHYILGAWILEHPEDISILDTLAQSGDLWRERVSVISTMKFISNNDFNYTMQLSKKFLNHKHDLMHKAVGWMLREVGKRDESTLVRFLDAHYPSMPRTMLRYAIEKLEEPLRQSYLKGTR